MMFTRQNLGITLPCRESKLETFVWVVNLPAKKETDGVASRFHPCSRHGNRRLPCICTDVLYQIAIIVDPSGLRHEAMTELTEHNVRDLYASIIFKFIPLNGLFYN
jgi:hypothetical protein